MDPRTDIAPQCEAAFKFYERVLGGEIGFAADAHDCIMVRIRTDGERENMRDLLVELLINPLAKTRTDGCYIPYRLQHILPEVEEGLRRLGYSVTNANGDYSNGRLLPR